MITLKTDAIVRIDEGIVTLITMYDKAEINSISSRELDRISKNSDLK